jgi:hypothetical protein
MINDEDLTMAKFTLEVEDEEDGGMIVSIKGESLKTYKTTETNTTTQNLAVLIVGLLRDVGIKSDSLPNIDAPTN